MKPLFVIVASVALIRSGWAAETIQQRLDRLQRGIDVASELGRIDRAKSLREELAEEARRAGNFVVAARQYELLLASRPGKRDRIRLFVELGRMRRALQDYTAAIRAYQDALHDDSKSWDANLELAQTYALADLNVLALELYKKCAKINREAPEAYQGMAQVYQKQGYLTKAIAEYKKALKVQESPDIYLAMADCYVRMDDLPKAAEILQEGKTLLPGADYDARLGDIFQRRGDLALASSAWEAALKADGKRDDLRLKLAMVYERLGRVADTDKMLRTLEAGYPQSPLVHFLRGWIHYERGDHAAARREALTVEKLGPTELVKHYNDRLLELSTQ